jgi:hypothetical protein
MDFRLGLLYLLYDLPSFNLDVYELLIEPLLVESGVV